MKSDASITLLTSSSLQASPTAAIKGSALDWWLEPTQQSTYPRLARMAIDILSIPSMSAESERVFSSARHTISWDRSSLGAVVVEQSECLKSWIDLTVKSGGFTTEEVATTVLGIKKDDIKEALHRQSATEGVEDQGDDDVVLY